jgi:hypothetical protein
LLTLIQPAVPTEWTVIVMSDRGLYAPWLYQHIVSLGWHPFMRINKQGNFRPLGEATFRGLSTVAPTGGSEWCGSVDCFSEPKSRLRCTLLARWDEGYEEVWLVVTDLAPEQATVVWYGMRSWIEGGFKDTKRGGWQWHQTKMVDPARAERLWLAIAVATLWVVSVGGQADANMPVSSLEALPASVSSCFSAQSERQDICSSLSGGCLMKKPTIERLIQSGPSAWPCLDYRAGVSPCSSA